MKGLEGVIIERRGKHRLLVAIEYIQQGVSVISTTSCWKRPDRRTPSASRNVGQGMPANLAFASLCSADCQVFLAHHGLTT
jgi:hypothetical protein